MVIEIRLYDSLRNYLPSSSSGIVTVDVLGDITVGELLDELDIDKDKVSTIVVNSQKSTLETVLHDGDKLNLFGK